MEPAESTFVLIPGAGGAAWYWSRVVPLLRRAGHEAVAVDLPGDDESAGLTEYTNLVLEAIGEREDVVLVAQSLGAFTAPLVCHRTAVRELILVNAMIPVPGETPGAWWENTGWAVAQRSAAEAQGYSTEFDVGTYFLHDVPPDVAAEGEMHQRPGANAVFESVCNFDEWPKIPIRILAGEEDRFFPIDFQRRVARERLGLEPDVVPGGHLLALANPEAVANYLIQDRL
ncbi:alpha/beta hydrolase [Pseudarthrobacter sp. fls2-241-R2A-168]|uniref:alpha/beta fold hydrolase n=1 Tax=Pseudarthrobacter sp. fls2-241-R2A-168 TaxID=3040304 RepID=UPI002556CC5A|nr:alpha/beta hydrolase [Pseudarthrobacter sp. fls2-241-R2A-168]